MHRTCEGSRERKKEREKESKKSRVVKGQVGKDKKKMMREVSREVCILFGSLKGGKIRMVN